MASPMIENPENYFSKLVSGRDPLLLQLEEEASQEEIPIVGPLVGELLYILVRSTGARGILELGTATGYSTIFLARGCEPVDGRVVSIESNPNLADRARLNFQSANLSERIEVRVGDAKELMASMTDPFDFIFMDIDKQFYLEAIEPCTHILKSGGLMVVDNVGFLAAEEFNQAISSHPSWRCVHLLSWLPFHSPERDGLCFALRL